MKNFMTVALWALGLICMWIPNYGYTLTMLLWALPAGIAAGNALAGIMQKDIL